MSPAIMCFPIEIFPLVARKAWSSFTLSLYFLVSNMHFVSKIVVNDAILLTIVLSGLLLLCRPKDHDVLLIREILVFRPFVF